MKKVGIKGIVNKGEGFLTPQVTLQAAPQGEGCRINEVVCFTKTLDTGSKSGMTNKGGE
ncbi:MAG: hypothetical protein NTX32_06830 [Candidatus Firestonebacteria bacterium]|nr:hypothetical protein [Candidatus Firestonebacteria bacterium]